MEYQKLIEKLLRFMRDCADKEFPQALAIQRWPLAPLRLYFRIKLSREAARRLIARRGPWPSAHRAAQRPPRRTPTTSGELNKTKLLAESSKKKRELQVPYTSRRFQIPFPGDTS
jgi:hypothetical protein